LAGSPRRELVADQNATGLDIGLDLHCRAPFPEVSCERLVGQQDAAGLDIRLDLHRFSFE
jgi:hypothetical protein